MRNVISVIIPVYNVEAYLEQCLNSVLHQSYKELEILLIDDGSTDSSGDICEEFSKKDVRIKLVHQKNGGAANAKNTGLKIATGYYLAFLDSDDFLESDAYEKLLSEMKESKADIVQGSFRDIYVNGFRDRIMVPKRQEFSTDEYIKKFVSDWTCGLMTDKLFVRSLFDGVFFEEGHAIDDEFFTYQGCMNAKKIVHIPDIVYNYRRRKTAVTQNENKKNQIVLDKIDYLDKRRRNISQRFPALKQDFDYHYISALLYLAEDSFATVNSVSICQKKMKELFRENCGQYELSLKVKAFFLIHSKPETYLKKHKQPVPEPLKDRVLFE